MFILYCGSFSIVPHNSSLPFSPLFISGAIANPSLDSVTNSNSPFSFSCTLNCTTFESNSYPLAAFISFNSYIWFALKFSKNNFPYEFEIIILVVSSSSNSCISFNSNTAPSTPKVVPFLYFIILKL